VAVAAATSKDGGATKIDTNAVTIMIAFRIVTGDNDRG